MRRHFAVLGSTGVGKTTSVSLLLKKSLAMMPKLRIIIFDPHNEYAAHFPGLAQIIDLESLELPFWMFKFDELSDVVFSGRQPHADERDALYEVIRVARAKYQAELNSSAGRVRCGVSQSLREIQSLPIRQRHIASSTSSQ